MDNYAHLHVPARAQPTLGNISVPRKEAQAVDQALTFLQAHPELAGRSKSGCVVAAILAYARMLGWPGEVAVTTPEQANE